MNTPDVTIPTEEQVVAFFKSKLTDFQRKLPGYASIKIDVTRSSGHSDFEVEWGVYHNDNGHCDKAATGTLGAAIGWHFSNEVTKRKIAALREQAAQANKQADEMEAAL